MKIEDSTYSYYGKVKKLTNGTVEVLVTTDLGPRVIYYGFSGGENILGELPESVAVESEIGTWHPYGGHRLWAAPEAMPRSYAPDNSPVQTVEVANGVRFTPPTESATQIQKEITVAIDPENTGVTISHSITNKGMWPVELAPWALTIMNGGGVTVFPQEPFIAHGDVLLPARPMVLWNFTDMSDPRWTFGNKFVHLKTDSTRDFAQKIGAAVKAGWGGYLREGLFFVKRFPWIECATYADFGCNFETYTKGGFMEVESLGTLVKLEPGESTTHVEQWCLFKGVNAGDTEDDLDAAILPLVQEAMKR